MVPPLRKLISIARWRHPSLSLTERIDGEAAESALARKYPRRLEALLLDLKTVGIVSREAAADKDLATGAAEHLIVRRDA